MFQQTKQEFMNLRYHFDTSSWGGTRYLPFAFTQEGVAMLSSVLRHERAGEGEYRNHARFRSFQRAHFKLKGSVPFKSSRVEQNSGKKREKRKGVLTPLIYNCDVK